jgi:hypothetical protein
MYEHVKEAFLAYLILLVAEVSYVLLALKALRPFVLSWDLRLNLD